MGIRLVKYGVNNGTGTYYHDELSNRDLPDQHPISAITGLEDKIKQIDLDIQNVTGIEETIETRSLKLEYNKSAKTLTGNVKIFASEQNAIQEKTTGLFVDKNPEVEIEDTDSVHLYMEGLGETLETMYKGGNVFSHNGGTNNIYNSSEAKAWYFDYNLKSFVQPLNTGSFTGFVSSIKYKTYVHRATLRSSASDNDANGLVIAYVKDANGYPHTLSCIINKGGESHAGSFYYALVYNRGLSGQQIIKTGKMSSGHSTGGWSNSYITMEVSKAGNAIECSISNWNSLVINTSTVIYIDLNDYSWGNLFIDRVQYGYCNQSQPDSYFTDIYFSGKGPLKSDIILSPDEGNCLIIKENGLYCNTNTEEAENSNSNILEIQQDNHKLSIGNVVYLKEDGLYDKAFGEDSNRIEVIGIITKVIDENNFVITVSGEFKTDIYNSYKNGDVLYLSNSNLGELTNVMQTYIKPVGIKIKDGILINVQRSNVYGLGDEDEPEIEYYTEEEILELIESLW